MGLHIIMLTTTSGLHSILPTTHTARREGPYHAFDPLRPLWWFVDHHDEPLHIIPPGPLRFPFKLLTC